MQSGSAREERRDWEDCADALSLLLLSFSFPRSQTHTHTRLRASSPRSTPTCCLCRAQLATLSSALRGRVWRQEESREIEVENEKVEEDVDVYDEGRKKERIERLKECIPGWMWSCLPEAEVWRHSPKRERDKDTKKWEGR